MENVKKVEIVEKNENIEKLENTNKVGLVFGKIHAFFSNQWTKLGFSVLSLGYGYFLGWVAYLTLTCFMSTDNFPLLIVVYSFINVLFAILMIYTRKSLLTQIVALFMHPCILIMVIWGFGNWFLIIPPFITATVIFFASGANESLKVILGTIYMIVFVLAVLVYLTLQNLTILEQVPGIMDFERREYPSINLDKRNSDEPNKFRLVMYVDDESKQNRVAVYYVERAELDMNFWKINKVKEGSNDEQLWLLKCEWVWGSSKAATIRVDQNPVINWEKEDILLINGDLKDIDENGQVVAADEGDMFTGNETTIIVTPPQMTQTTPSMTRAEPD
ncbi:MAG: hypothetical protein FWD34_09680 [Oscillospiraceae bacterium]|nr:hypothetical protein [Oscillospiraceae bacterium]